MEEKQTVNITFNITGGNNQICRQEGIPGTPPSLPGQSRKRQGHRQPAPLREQRLGDPQEMQALAATIGHLPNNPRVLPLRPKETRAPTLGFPPDDPRTLSRATKDIPPMHQRHMDTTIDINNGENQVMAHVDVVNNYFGQTPGTPEPRLATAQAAAQAQLPLREVRGQRGGQAGPANGS